MDTLTHFALGACIGEAMIGHKAGKKGMLIGALAQSLPDIDFLASFFTSTSQNLLAHRGFTHSILFALVFTPIISLIFDHWGKPLNVSFKRWMVFFAVQSFVHVFIDAFNNYGVGWLEPFNHIRVSFNSIYVADPFFSIWPFFGALILLALKSISRFRKMTWRISLFLCFFYLVYSLGNKQEINDSVKFSLAQQNIRAKRFFTTPAPLQNWLWYVVAETDSGFQVGYRSVFDTSEVMHFHYFPKNEQLILHNTDPAIARLKRFSKGYYTIEKYGDTTVFNDLRFGQIIGWQSPEEKFAFHYFVGDDYDNVLVVQRGRFAKWDKAVFKKFIERIKGI